MIVTVFFLFQFRVARGLRSQCRPAWCRIDRHQLAHLLQQRGAASAPSGTQSLREDRVGETRDYSRPGRPRPRWPAASDIQSAFDRAGWAARLQSAAAISTIPYGAMNQDSPLALLKPRLRAPTTPRHPPAPAPGRAPSTTATSRLPLRVAEATPGVRRRQAQMKPVFMPSAPGWRPIGVLPQFHPTISHANSREDASKNQYSGSSRISARARVARSRAEGNLVFRRPADRSD